MFFGTQMEIVYSPTNEKQDAKDKIDRIWSYDPLEGFRLLEQAQVSNVEGDYECRAEKRSATGTVYQMEKKKFEIKHSLAGTNGLNSAYHFSSLTYLMIISRTTCHIKIGKRKRRLYFNTLCSFFYSNISWIYYSAYKLDSSFDQGKLKTKCEIFNIKILTANDLY